jgi:acyl carrier protein phosphodiesterase
MNHLAHVFLSGADADVRLGAMLGDFWHGAPDPAWPAGVRGGVLLHRKIDVYTDSHPLVLEAKSLFESPWRRFAGILLDVYFDYALARDWSRYADEPIDALSASTLHLLEANASWLPPGLVSFSRYMRTHGLFGRYAERAMIERVLAGIGARLRHANPLHQAGPALWSKVTALDTCFEEFFPQLQAEVLRLRGMLRM